MSVGLRIKLLFLFVVLFFNMTAVNFYWFYIPSFSLVEKVVVSGDMIYVLSSGNLFSYDKKSEIIKHENLNGPSGAISSIYGDLKGSYIAVAYSGGHLDLIKKGNEIVSLSLLDNLDSSSDKVIENISFDNDNMLVATCLGPVIIDLKTNKIVKSGNIHSSVNAFVSCGENYYLCFDHYLYKASKTADLRRLDSFEKITYSDCIDLFPVVNEKTIFGISDNDRGRRLIKYKFNDNGEVTVNQFDGNVLSDYIIKDPSGGFSVIIDSKIYKFDSRGELKSTQPVDIDIKAIDQNGLYWVCATDGGLQCYVDNNNKPKNSVKPDAIGVKSVDIMRFESNNNLISATTTPYSRFNGIEDKKNLTPISVFNNDIQLDSVAHVTDLVVSPVDNQYYFVGSYTDGLIRLKNGKTDLIINELNSPLKKWWGCSAEGLTFDSDNNLWVVAGYDVTPVLMMLPADKTLKNIIKTDWVVADVSPFTVQIDGDIEVVNDIVIVTSSDYRRGMLLYNKATKKSVHFSSFTDSDMIGFTPDYIYHTFVDRRGRLWVLTSSGIFYINDIQDFFNRPNSTVIRPKVNRDDSTLLADHALNGVDVVGITEDGAGQKWFATRDEGVYLFNEDCSSLLNHFTSENSPLTTDNIKSIAADNQKGYVYVGTSSGLFRINGNAPNSAVDYSDVKIYPNPVKPGYNGNITVDNVIDKADISVMDSRGRLLLMVKATGGRAVFNPSSLKSGIYHLAVSNGKNNSKLIGKLVIIR